MNANNVLELTLKKSSKTVTLIGVLILLLGVVAIIYPASAGKIATITIGIFLIAGGLFRLSFAIFSASMGSLLLRYLMAIIMIIAGVWLIGNKEVGLETLTLVLAIYFIVDGLTSIAYSFSLMPIGGGFYLIINGLIGVLLGILIWSNWPEASNYFIGIYLGVKLVFEGLTFILTGQAIRKTIQ